MNALVSSFSPRGRLLCAAALLVGLATLAPLGGLSWVGVSRLLVGSMALAGLAWVLFRKGSGAGDARAPRVEPLSIVSRTGLSQRCGLALVQVEGRHYLVAYGDTFAEIREAGGAEATPAPKSPLPAKRRVDLDLEATVLFTRAQRARQVCSASRKRGGG